ncbi:hypothetical protein K435DRAFT_779936 [Dendrothele bispora CBS 962.96]|uniref:Uncharacterized protein n=1 Tax=Dendrothele bispora (strain CBS 962.96) TaxID=1314807 RepID=A0A4S8LUR6_DENBC|nr:hypothetical protein K435DRAFT_779936 [Dendrothele bispora CBS 962.96]
MVHVTTVDGSGAWPLRGSRDKYLRGNQQAFSESERTAQNELDQQDVNHIRSPPRIARKQPGLMLPCREVTQNTKKRCIYWYKLYIVLPGPH